MARSHFRYTVTDGAGNAIQNAKCFLYQPGTTTAVTDAWSAPAAGSAVTFLITNIQGEGECWFDTPQEVDVSITDNGHSAYYPGRQDVTAVLGVPAAAVALLAANNNFIGNNTFNGTTQFDGDAAVSGDLEVSGDINMGSGGYLEGDERSDPSAPSANQGRIYFRDNGSGKTQLVAKFNTGAVQVIAAQP